jgi:hypothetical protein
MIEPGRNLRGAYDSEGHEIPPCSTWGQAF